ncbi:MAG: DegT/DnrJ/EryC1/StrS family aminotransferase [Dermatophilaceae bacterium]
MAEPTMAGNEKAYVLDCLDSGWISSNGKYIPLFEDAFAAFAGSRYAVATNNGTTGLHLALTALGIGPGDEVIVPTVTYIASANAVRYCGAEAVLVDVTEDGLLLDPAAVERAITPRTKAIMPVHLYGRPADLMVLGDIARKHALAVVEDAAEAHGAEVEGRRVGSIGTCGVFSFFGNKILTTGEGGMVTTDDAELAARLRLLRGQGMDLSRRYWFPVVGFNYRMTNIEAAIGLAQLEQVDRLLAGRARLSAWYDAALAPLDGALIRPSQAPGTKTVCWMYTVYLRQGGTAERDHVMARLDEAGIETRPVFYPLHQMPPYARVGDFRVADTWAARGINLPTHLALGEAEVDRVAAALSSALRA